MSSLFVVIEVLSASGLVGKDKSGQSDPFCTIRFRKNKYRTKTHAQTVNPVWNERFKLGLFSENDEVEITCWAKERMSSSDVLGYVTIPLKEFALPFMVGEHRKSYQMKDRPGQKGDKTRGSIQVKIIVKDKSNKKELKRKSLWSKRATTSSSNLSPASLPDGEFDKAYVKKKLTSFFKFRPASREEFEDRLSGSGVIPRTPKGAKVFGASLSDVMARQKLIHPELKVPLFVHLLLEKLSNNPLTFNEQGLFRISGSAITVQKIKSQVDSGKVPDLSMCNRDDLASLLKEYIRELPEPLFTTALFREWMEIYDTPRDKVVPALRTLVRKLPAHNRFLWKAVNKFLFDLSKHADVNMMTPQNIGIVIGPNVLWQPPLCMPVMEMNDVVCNLVERYEEIWAPGEEDEPEQQLSSSGSASLGFLSPSANPLRSGSLIGAAVRLDSPSNLRRMTAPPGVIQAQAVANASEGSIDRLPADPQRWGVGEVAEWLAMKGFSQYANAFEQHAINGETLLALTARTLLGELEVKSLGHRKKILFRIRDLQQQRG